MIGITVEQRALLNLLLFHSEILPLSWKFLLLCWGHEMLPGNCRLTVAGQLRRRRA